MPSFATRSKHAGWSRGFALVRGAYVFVRAAALGVFLWSGALASVFAGDLASLLGAEALSEARSSGVRRIVVPPGVYRLERTGAGPHLSIKDLHDVEVDARGAQIVFATPGAEGLVFDRCSGVVWKGGLFTREQLPFSQGRIEEVSDDGRRIVIRIADGYPTRYAKEMEEKGAPFYVFDAATRRFKSGSRDFYSERIEQLDDRRFALHLAQAPVGTAGMNVGDLMAWRGVVVSDVRLVGCGGMTFEGTTVMGGGGLCFFEGNGPGPNTYTVNVTYPARPSGAREDPLLSSNADAFHSSGMRQGPRLIGCRFEGMGDDGIAIHGNYARIVAIRGDVLELAYFASFGLREGDRLQISDYSGKVIARALAKKVGKVRPGKGGDSRWSAFRSAVESWLVDLVLDRPVACREDYLVGNEEASGKGFVVRDSIVRDNRARGILIKAGGGLIEGNLIEGSTMGGIVVAPEMGIWSESGYGFDLTIRRNRLRRVGIWQQDFNPMAGALTVAAFEDGTYVGLPGGHENIVIEDNRFEDTDGVNLLVSSARRVRIANNKFVRPMRNPQSRGALFDLPENALAVILESADVDMIDNEVCEPGTNMEELIYAPGLDLSKKGFRQRAKSSR